MDPAWVILAEDYLHGSFQHFQNVWYDVNTGLHELTADICSGCLRIGTREVVVCLLGQADIIKGRIFPAVIERFIQVCKTLGENTLVVLGGPFPNLFDGQRALAKLNRAQLYLEDRLLAESRVVFCRTAERFTDNHGVHGDLIAAEGLTPRGVEVMTADLLDVIHATNAE